MFAKGHANLAISGKKRRRLDEAGLSGQKADVQSLLKLLLLLIDVAEKGPNGRAHVRILLD